MTASTATPPRVQFSFGKYTVRPITEADRALLDSFIAEDRDHAGRVLPDFFIRNLPGEDSWAIEDEFFRVVFYLKTVVACRLHIQFGPSAKHADRERNREALTKGLEWLEPILAGNGFRELCFDSRNTPLILFAEKRLGFAHAPDELRRSIPARHPDQGANGIPRLERICAEGRV